jgi:broad specificity phosphatase PhoE
VLTSPLQRARRTCELAGFGAEALVTEDLAEWDYGKDEGRTKAEILVDDPSWDIWREGPHGGEPLAALAARVARVIDIARQAGGDVLCFAHGHSLRTLAAVWFELDPAFAGHLHLDPTTISVLGWEHGRPALIEWNARGSRPGS